MKAWVIALVIFVFPSVGVSSPIRFIKNFICTEDLEGEYLEIRTPRLLLRPAVDSDLLGIHRLYSAPDTMTGLYGSWAKYIDEDWAQNDLQQRKLGLYSLPSNPNGNIRAFEFVISQLKSKKFLGFGSLKKKYTHWELSYALLPEHRGQGYATETVRGLIDYVCVEEPNAVFKAGALAKNNESHAVLERLHFQRVQSEHPNVLVFQLNCGQ